MPPDDAVIHDTPLDWSALASAIDRPAIFPAPAFALRMLLGEMADPLLLSSQRVSPTKLTAMNYAFRSSDLAATLKALLG